MFGVAEVFIVKRNGRIQFVAQTFLTDEHVRFYQIPMVYFSLSSARTSSVCVTGRLQAMFLQT